MRINRDEKQKRFGPWRERNGSDGGRFLRDNRGYHVSRLLNFVVTTFPMTMSNRSTIMRVISGCDVPLNTLMLVIIHVVAVAAVGGARPGSK